MDVDYSLRQVLIIWFAVCLASPLTRVGGISPTGDLLLCLKQADKKL